MDEKERTEYHAYVRGAATYTLLEKRKLSVASAEPALLYKPDLSIVDADIDALIQFERHKIGGILEVE